MLPVPVTQQIATEVRYAFRRLRRSAGFSAVAIVLLALGIGTSTTIFTVANAVLFRPLPVRRAQSLVQLFERYPNIRPQSHLPYALYEDIRDHSSSLSDVIGRLEMSTVLERNADPERVNVDLVTDGFLSALGPGMAMGRGLGLRRITLRSSLTTHGRVFSRGTDLLLEPSCDWPATSIKSSA